MISKPGINDKLSTVQGSLARLAASCRLEDEWPSIDDSRANNPVRSPSPFKEAIISPRFPIEEEDVETKLQMRDETIEQLTQSLESSKNSQIEKDKEIYSLSHQLYEAKLKIEEQENLIKELSFKLKTQGNSMVSVSKELFSKAEKLETEREKLQKDNLNLMHRMSEADFKLKTFTNDFRLTSRRESKNNLHKFKSSTPLTEKIIVAEIANELGVSSTANVLPAIRALKKTNLLRKRERQFIEKVSGLIKQLSPSQDEISLSTTWLWIRNLVQEYLLLKKQDSENNDESIVLKQLMQALNVRKMHDIPHKIRELLVENEFLLVMVSKLKYVFKMKSDASLEDLNKEIRRHM